MAQGDERRAIGRANETARRAIGTNNETARRAIGARINAERRGDQVADDINRLRRPEPRRAQPLRTLTPVGSVAPMVGRGAYKPPPATPGMGGGIASPLTEESYADREYWAEKEVSSSDGLLTFRVKPIKAITQTDASGAEVVQNFAEPVEP